MKTFILFWNPSISNDKGEGRIDFIKALNEGYDYSADWAIWDWKEAQEGDRFYKVMCGNADPKLNGIIEAGFFASAPYQGEDWSGRGRTVYYCDLEYDSVIDYNKISPLTAEILAEAIPDFDWTGGHSGRVLDEESANMLYYLWNEHLLAHDVLDSNKEHAFILEDYAECLAKWHDDEEEQGEQPFEPKEDFFHVFKAQDIDFAEMCARAAKLLSTGSEQYTIVEQIFDGDEDVDTQELLYIKGLSAQGVTIVRMKDNVTHIQLSWMASIGDIQLCWAILKAIKSMRPESIILANQDTEELALEDGYLAGLTATRMQNMISALEVEHLVFGIAGVRHGYYIDTDIVREVAGDDPIDMTAVGLMEDFCKSQWRYEDYDMLGIMEITEPDGEKYDARVLANSGKVFVGQCQRLCLMNSKKQIKIVKVGDFIEAVQDTPYYQSADFIQFAMDKMPSKKWEALFDQLDGKMMEGK